MSGEDASPEFVCQPCLHGGEYKAAHGYCRDCREYLCQVCFHYHTRPRPFRNHALTEMDQLDTKPPLTLTNIHMDTCLEHFEQKVEYFCAHHEILGCGRCLVKHQKDCNNMKGIDDVAKDVKQKQEYVEFNQKMKDIEEKSKVVLGNVTQSRKESVKNSKDAIQTFDKVQNQLLASLNEIKKDIVSRLETIQCDDSLHLDDVEEECKATGAKVHTIMAEFDNLAAAGQDAQLFIALKRAEAQLATAQAELEQLTSKSRVRKYVLQPNLELISTLMKPNTLYTMCEKKVKKLEKLTDVVVHSKSDEFSCTITSFALIGNQKLVATDNMNMKVKLLDLSSGEILSELKLSSEPEGVTAVGDSKVAVALPNTETIKIMDTEPCLLEEREIKAKGKCQDVAFSRDKLVVAYSDPDRIGIMDLTGHMIDNIVSHALASPVAITASHDGNFLFVSNSGNHTVAKLSLDHTVKAIYTDPELKTPRQITVDHQGRVFLCSSGTHTVHQITADCCKVQVLAGVADGLYFPTAVIRDPRADRLYIGGSGNHVHAIQLAYTEI